MDRLLRIGACMMTAFLATGVAAATVDVAADGSLDLVTDHGRATGVGGGSAHANDDGASATAAGGTSAENEQGSASGNAGGSASATKPQLPELPEPGGSASALGELGIGSAP